jgi:hypothetical protein
MNNIDIENLRAEKERKAYSFLSYNKLINIHYFPLYRLLCEPKRYQKA